jgi:hypothetical protein
MKRSLLVVACLTALMAASGGAAEAAATDPFTSGSQGYDAASGQCNTNPPAAQFAILNVTGGRPFSVNSCVGSEAAVAPASVSLYFNTGYSGAYGRNVSSACNTSATAHAYTGKVAQAYAIGCSEAGYAVAESGGIAGASWWLDVELANSWSSSGRSLNVATIQGAVDEVHAGSSAPVGIYSTVHAWQTITGGAAVKNVDASWVVARDGYACSGPAFASAPVWLVQNGTVTSGGVRFDSDTAC